MEKVTEAQNAKLKTQKAKPITQNRWACFAFCFLSFAFSRFCGAAESAEALYKQGNAAYAEGRFADALSAYEAAKAQGAHSWVLEYNLGNAHYRLGQLGHSVACFARAFRLNSSDRDIIDNLQLAAAKAGDSWAPASGLGLFFWRLFYWPSLNTLALVTSVWGLILAGLWFRTLWRGRWPMVESWALLGALLVISGGWLAARADAAHQPLAVVVAPVAEVRSGPTLSYAANFTVPEGRRVTLLEEQEPVQGWVEIGVPAEGLKGWVPESAVEQL